MAAASPKYRGIILDQNDTNILPPISKLTIRHSTGGNKFCKYNVCHPGPILLW